MPHTKSDEAIARVGHERHARVADQGDLGTLLHGEDKFRGTRKFVVLVIADERFVNIVVSEQLLRVTSVFTSDLVDFFEDAQPAQGDVFEIAYGRAHEIETARGGVFRRGG